MRETQRKIALVTGASGVLGMAIVGGLIEDGYRVAALDIDQERLNQYCDTMPRDRIVPVVCDVSDPRLVEKAVATVNGTWAEIDVLINNAGILSNNKAAQTPPEEWRRVLSVNLDGAFYLSRICMESMKRKRWGRIVNITSLAAKSGGITAGTAYSVSKGGLISLTFSLAAELAGFGVTVNGIAPAYIVTPMITTQLTKKQRSQLVDKIPVKRFCEPEEVSNTVRFLVNPLSGFITGEIIDQNGGLHFD